MTSYIAITDAETDPEAPLTSELAKKWRDNPIAIGEGDASVPSTLLPTVLLGTITAVNGTTSQTLSGLTLTPYKFLLVVFDYVYDNTGTSGSTRFNGATVHSGGSSSQTTAIKGFLNIDLSKGFGQAQTDDAGATGTTMTNIVTTFSPAISNSTTSLSLTTLGAGVVLTSGNVKIYGVK